MRTLSAFAMLFLVTACQAPPAEAPPPEMTEAEIAAEVEMVLDDWWAVWSAGEDFDRFMTFFADDPEVLWIADAVPTFGKAAIDANFRPSMENFQRQDNTRVEWRTEPWRYCRRLHRLRGWSHEQNESIYPGRAGPSGSDGPRP